MINLLKEISEMGAFTFIIVLAIALLIIKEIVSLIEFFYKKAKGHFSDKTNNENLYQQIQEINQAISLIQKQQSENQKSIDILIQSDIEDIRAWIVNQYHTYRDTDKELDDFTMDCIEKRFRCYHQEGGNSYIEDLVNSLREYHRERRTKE